MADILLKNIRILAGPGADPAAPQDMTIENGVITAVGPGLKPLSGMTVRDCAGAWLSAGWVDIGVSTCDPGYEHREDLHTTAAAAAAGGFTAVATNPNTNPAIHSKAEVLYVKNKTAALPVRFLPLGAISHHLDGKDLAELYDMHEAGAIAFSDGTKPVQDAGLLLRALQYSQAFDGLVLNQPHHKTIAASGQLHEGKLSTMLGMKGIPALAEEIMVQRDLSLLAYSGGRLHIHLLSTVKSVDLIREAKQNGLSVSSSAAAINLFFTVDELAGFDSLFKVNPPLREERDREALIRGLADDSIDVLCSNHIPWDTEAKNLEYPYAEFGAAGLETAFSASRTALDGQLSTIRLVDKWAYGPRRVLGIEIPAIAVGEKAELTIFQPDEHWTVTEKDLRSRSRNNPFLGRTLKGRVVGIVNNNQAVWNN